ncbi:MAG: IS256 family transposase [Acidobacteria bacterium]|nr:IS256 family transposase [Acidobacteriota bacterium]MCI0656699.1 IS256 family transposase [Acidobacteriota bacterium]
MEEKNTKGTEASRVVWGALEQWARGKIQEWLQWLLETEVTELLGREKSERREAVDAGAGFRNGYGKPRRLSMTSGTITVRRPRVRGLEGRFESRILPAFKRRTEQVGELLPELYLHGLAQGDFELALRGLLGEGAPLSPSSIARLTAGWQNEYEAWKSRPLDELEVVYVWADGIYVKAGLEKEKAAVLVVIGALRDGTKVVLALQSGHRESTESWAGILRDLKRRGLNAPKCVIADGNLGLWGALAQVFPEAAEQRCWNHRIVNVLDKVSKKEQPQARILLKAIPYEETLEQAERLKKKFQTWCEKKRFTEAARLIDQDWERMVTFYAFPKEHWKHLRTSNVVESPFAAVRLRTGAAKRYKRMENATAVIWKTLLVAEGNFRRLDHPELLAEVAEEVMYVDGVRAKRTEAEAAA